MVAMTQQILLGTGLYSFPRAAQLTGIPAQSLRRWASGRSAPEGLTAAKGVIDLDLPDVDDERALSFLNLIELKLIGEFRRHNLSLQYIRRVVDVLQDSYSLEHPLACRRLMTDGRSIFAEIDEMGEFACIEIAGRRPNHFVMEDVVRPFFHHIEFYEETDLAKCWFPAGKQGGIVVDPLVAFGEPLLVNYGISTAILAALAKAGDSVERIAEWYEVPVDSARRAIEFERGLLRRAA